MLRLWWKRLWGWELTLRAVLPAGRVAWSLPRVRRYRVLGSQVYALVATGNMRTDALLSLPEGARLQEVWVKCGQGKPVRYGM